MIRDRLPQFLRDALRGRFLPLLIALLLYFALVPLLEGFVGVRILINNFFSVILISGVYAVSDRRHPVRAALFVLFLLGLVWVAHFAEIPAITLASHGIWSLFFAYSIITILSFVFREKKVTANVICAAIVAYMLIGLMWSEIFSIMDILQPDSFAFAHGDTKDSRLALTYYSFVTLTTLGYGDVTPVSDPARSYAILEAIIGQIFLTVLVARLVGLQISQAAGNKSQ